MTALGPADHLVALLDAAELGSDDAVWLTAGSGLVQAVREVVLRRDGALLARIDQSELREMVTDMTPAVDRAGTHVPSRIDALLAAGRVALWTSGSVDSATIDEIASLLRSISPTARLTGTPERAENLSGLLDGIRSNEPGAAAAAVDLIRHLADIPSVSADAADVTVEFPISRHSVGDIYMLTVRAVPGPESAIGPDLVHGLFTYSDPQFRDALAAAVTAFGTSTAALWAVRSARTQLAVDTVTGPSVGLAMAIATRALKDPEVARHASGWLFTGRVEANGTMATLRSGLGAGEYPQKLSAATGRLVMVPVADSAPTAQLADTARVARLVGVSGVDDAVAVLSRHAATNHTIVSALTGVTPDSPVVRRVRRKVLVPVAAVLIAGFGVLALALWPDDTAVPANNLASSIGGVATSDSASGGSTTEARAAITPPVAGTITTTSAPADTTARSPAATPAPSPTRGDGSGTTALAPPLPRTAPPPTTAPVPTTETPPVTTPVPTTATTSPPVRTPEPPLTDVPGTPLTLGVAQTGSSPGTTNLNAPVYAFELAAGMVARVVVSWEASAQAAFAIFEPHRTKIRGDDGPSDRIGYCSRPADKRSAVIVFAADENGPHYVQVRASAPTSFTVVADVVPADTPLTACSTS